MSLRAWQEHLPAGGRADELDLTASRSLPAAWAANWQSQPSARVLSSGDRSWVTAEELEDATRRAAGRLRGAGLEPGDRILFSAGSSIELVVAHVAALRAGLVVVPANTAYRQRELAHLITDARPKAAVIDAPERARWVAAADPELLVLTPALELPVHGPPALDLSGPDEPALIGYTSGTTGSPKGAVLTHGNLLAGSESVRLAWRWSAADRLVLALPLFHVHGLCVGLHGTLLAGASAVLLPRFDPDAVLDAVSAHRASLFFGVPTMYHRLARSVRIRELGALRLLVSGSAPLPAELHQALAERCGQQVLERYGMTETMMNASNPYEGERRPGSVGFPLPGVGLRLESGEEGEILVRGPNVFSGYWGRPDATADSFTPDGWFRTGDLGRLDPDGYLRILGRSKELIISGGLNVYPREVEDVLLGHPAVAEVAVVGLASEEWGETVAAFVVANGTCEVEALGEFAAERLAPFKRPRQIHLVESLPRNALGKVLKHELG